MAFTDGNRNKFCKLESSIQKPCIKSPLSNSLPQEGVTACRRVKIDFERLKTLRAGDKLALLPGHEVIVIWCHHHWQCLLLSSSTLETIFFLKKNVMLKTFIWGGMFSKWSMDDGMVAWRVEGVCDKEELLFFWHGMACHGMAWHCMEETDTKVLKDHIVVMNPQLVRQCRHCCPTSSFTKLHLA